MAAQTVLLGDDTGGLTKIGHHLVAGTRGDQDHAGAELHLHVCLTPADADSALGGTVTHTHTGEDGAAHLVDLHHVGAAGQTRRDAGSDDHQVILLDEASTQRLGHRVIDHLVSGTHIVHDDGGNAPGQSQLTLDLLGHDAGNDGCIGAEAADESRGNTGGGHGDDGSCVDILGGGAGCVSRCAADTQTDGGDDLLGSAKVVDVPFGTLGNGRHGLHRLHGVLAGSGLTGEHHGGGAVIHGVGHVSDLSTGRTGVGYHAVQHLGCRDDMLAHGQGTLDQVLLDDRDLGKVDLHTHIAAGHHDAISHSQDLVHVVHALLVLQLGDDSDVGLVLVQQTADLQHILGVAAEGSGDKVKVLLDAEENICPVLGAHIRHGQVDAGDVDPLLILDGAAVFHAADDISVADLQGGHTDETVVQHDGGAGLHILRQVPIADRADLLGALHFTGGQGEGLAGLQDLLAIDKASQTDLRALGVQQSAHRDAQFGTSGLQVFQPDLMLGVASVREVKAGHVHAVFDQCLQNSRIVGSRA